ncbi:MAG: tRNA (adenosine(37)-N6)-threonylcarbamoyltransferase complex ATPase subunit type 1 TsaE [Bacilli bacterium]|nr:tRNA (adenosine(37)-N6)-threonylcarbamoyltransferase complex ATPase subunit type 1 TsaE [Bacilli bacterium]
MSEVVIKTSSKEETRKLGLLIASNLQRGDVILLKGDLGAGKTTLVGGVAEGLNVKEDVISPTFNIMKCYFKGTIPLYHIDAYRLENQNIEIGLDEYIEGDGVCFIEWPVFIEKLIPEDNLVVTLKNIGGDNREITISSDSANFDRLISSIKEAFHD